ncbi:adropin precursor [Lynx pardinus]|uniref:Adropin n=1 Tax=Lynx pardinus TaxID=191816 RepID=A0A485MKF0_LYNPA|nr:adropin precursor [Lynx pardinus]
MGVLALWVIWACRDPKSSAREARDVGQDSLRPLLLGLTLPLPHHPFLCCVPATGSRLQVDISIAQESLSVWTEQPLWKASCTGVLPRHGPCRRASPVVCAGLRVLPVMGAAISQGALIAIVCNGLVGFLLLLLWVILCWACHSRSADIDSLSESSPNSSPGPCPEKAPPPQKPSHEGSYLLQP